MPRRNARPRGLSSALRSLRPAPRGYPGCYLGFVLWMPQKAIVSAASSAAKQESKHDPCGLAPPMQAPIKMGTTSSPTADAPTIKRDVRPPETGTPS